MAGGERGRRARVFGVPLPGAGALSVVLAGLATLALVVVLGGRGTLPLDRLTPLVFDAYQRVLPRPEAGAPLALVDIDEASLAALGQWPWPRSTIAELVERLGEMGAVTIAFDVVFAEPDRMSPRVIAEVLRRAGAEVTLPATDLEDPDERLAVAFGRNAVTAGFVLSNELRVALPPPKAGVAHGGSDPRGYLPAFSGGIPNLPALNDAATGLGFFSFPPERDGVVRRLPLIANAGGHLYPALSVEALRVAQGAGAIMLRSTDASGEATTEAPALAALRVGAFEAPMGGDGTFWVHFSGLPSMPVLPAADVLDPDAGRALAERVAGRIVLVGTSAVGLRDLVATPVDRSLPGVRVHAEIIDQIVGQAFLLRPDWAWGAEASLAILLGLGLVLVSVRRGAFQVSAATLLLAGVGAAFSWLAFARHGLLLDPILPATAVFSVFVVTMPLRLLLTDREKRFVRGAFGRYLAPELVERLAANPKELQLGGQNRELTVLFSDIRGFTGLSEGMNPTALTELLNGFLTPMTDVLLRSEATIDKYMGDAIMAFWNAPLDLPGHPRRACLAALGMVAALARMNAGVATPLRIGIGLNTGIACVGNLGSAQRFSYSAIGDNVNLAARIEGLTKEYDIPILASAATRAAAADLAFLEVDLVRVVGRKEPVAVHAVMGDARHAESPGFRALAAAHEQMIAAWRVADPGRAAAALAGARALAPATLSRLYGLYEARLAQMHRAPPPPGWDGVFDARTK